MRIKGLIFAGVFLVGCGTIQQVREPIPRAFNYGPSPTNLKKQIKAHMELSLFDADSAKYYLDDPVRAACHSNGNMNGEMKFETAFWVVPFEINAKNRLGGYVGRKQYYAKFSDGVVSNVTEYLGNCTRVDENGELKEPTRGPVFLKG